MREKTPRKFSTTPGTRDVLPPESTRLLDAQAKVLERFRLHGFREVITPALEYSEVIEEPKLRDSAFKLFDPDNQMLLLRPEVTTPVARLVAQRLRNSPPPYTLSYSLPVSRPPAPRVPPPRPEVPTPVARLVAQRLRNSPPPYKLSYSLPVYRRTGVGRGQSAERRHAGGPAGGRGGAAAGG